MKSLTASEATNKLGNVCRRLLQKMVAMIKAMNIREIDKTEVSIIK